jgi:hypothetical protein
MSVQLLRNTRVFLSTVTTGHAPTNTFEIQVGDDLSFSQATSSSSVEVTEAGATPQRGTAQFNDSLDPAEWSFSTYLRSYVDAGLDKFVPDALLWHALASGSAFDKTTPAGLSANDVNTLVKFTDNSHHELTKVQIYLLVDNIWYHIVDGQVGSATLSNEITDLGMTTWSGQGTLLNRLASAPFDIATEATTIDCSSTASFIRNKLTIMKLTDNSNGKVYTIPLTGGSVDFNNNITYLTPTTLSCLDVPIGSFTGSFSVTGNVTAYLSGAVAGSAELLDDLLTERAVTNSFELALVMGGSSATAAPGVVVVLPTAQISIPTISSADVIGTEMSFTGIGSDFGTGDEVFIGMSDTYTTTEIDRLIATGDGKL